MFAEFFPETPSPRHPESAGTRHADVTTYEAKHFREDFKIEKNPKPAITWLFLERPLIKFQGPALPQLSLLRCLVAVGDCSVTGVAGN
jgi:hypothetical protein